MTSFLSPDRSVLDTFVGFLFRHADDGTRIGLRAFVDGKRGEPPLFTYGARTGDPRLAEWVYNGARLTDLHARFAMMMVGESHEPEMVKALFRDLSAMMDTQAQRAAAHPIRPERDGRIEAALRSDPSSTDRHIARSFGCSPTTVGKVRRKLGLMAERRSVHRGGQVYGMSTRQNCVRTP